MNPPSNRACDYCRSLKVRCIIEFVSTSGKCQRCTKTDRVCAFAAPQKRKLRKRTDTRVAELEKEIRSMRALFQSQTSVLSPRNSEDSNNAGMTSNSHAMTLSKSTEQRHEYPMLGQIQEMSLQEAGVSSKAPSGLEPLYWISNGGVAFTPGLPSTTDEHVSPSMVPQNQDIVDRGLLSMECAAHLFDIYVNDLVQYFPAVVFPKGYSAQKLRRTKPTLFLAVITAAAGKTDPTLLSLLSIEVLHAFATRMVINSEKCLELVQSMIVTAVWYYPPDGQGQLKFYEYIHMAASMALDIGIGTKPAPSRRQAQSTEDDTDANAVYDSSTMDQSLVPLNPLVDHNGSDLERRRTFLACYLTCSSVSMSMRRPNMLRFNIWLSECVDYLETSPDAVQSDRCLLAWVRLLNITEEFGSSFSLDDPSSTVSLSEPRIQLMLKGFEKQLQVWRNEVDPDFMNSSLAIMYNNANIYLHEIAMHNEHSPEDFKPPYPVEKISTSRTSTHATPPYVDAITVCISSAHLLIEVFLGMEVESIRALPVSYYVRVVYAIFVLTKLYMSAGDPASDLGKFIDNGSLEVENYLDSLIDRLSMVSGPMKHKLPLLFLISLTKLRKWCGHQEVQIGLNGEDKNGSTTRPLKCSNSSNNLPLSMSPSTRALHATSDNLLGFGARTTAISNVDGHNEPMARLSRIHPLADANGPHGSSLHHNFDATSVKSALTRTVDPVKVSVAYNDQHAMTDNDCQPDPFFDHPMDLGTDFFSLFDDLGPDITEWDPAVVDLSKEHALDWYDWDIAG